MDKRKIIYAYQRGFITVQECAHILGIESVQMKGMLDDPEFTQKPNELKKHSANG